MNTSLIKCAVLVGLLTISFTTAQAVTEEILVTARKQSENLMEAPLSVTAVDAQTIAEANLQNVSDLANLTPNLKFNSGFGSVSDRPVIRGLSTNFLFKELAGYFVDGIWVSGSLTTYDLSNVERVEVIKGPQSATFGRRTFSGAINYVTQGPSEDLLGKVQLQAGSNSWRILQGSISDTVGNFGYIVTGRYYEYDGDFSNALVGAPNAGADDIGGKEQESINGTFVWNVSDHSSLKFNVNFTHTDNPHFVIGLQPTAENNCTFNNDPNTPFPSAYYCGTLDPSRAPIKLGGFYAPDQYGLDEDRLRTSLVWDFDLGWADLQWINAYNKREYVRGIDQSYNGTTFASGPAFHTIDDDEFTDYSSELWLRGGDALRWSVGAYYFNEEVDENGSTGFGSTFGEQEVTNTAIMGGIEYDINDQWTAGLELRFAEDEVSKAEADVGSPLIKFEDTFNSVTGRLTLSYQISDGTMLYGNVSTGVLPGGFNTDPDLVADRPELIVVEEQDLTQFELGLKSDINDNIRLTWAVYAIEWEDQARQQAIALPNANPPPPTVLIGYEDNQGTTDILGTEADISWSVTDNLILGGGFAYNNSEVDDFCSFDVTDRNINGNVVAGPDGGFCTDLSGNKTELVPELEVTTNLRYSTELGSGWMFSTRGDLSWQDTRYLRPINRAKVGTESILNWTATVGRDNFRISLWGKNLTDEDSAVSGLRYIEPPVFTDRAFAVTPRPGREFGLTFEMDFGQ